MYVFRNDIFYYLKKKEKSLWQIFEECISLVMASCQEVSVSEFKCDKCLVDDDRDVVEFMCLALLTATRQTISTNRLNKDV